MTPRYQWRVDSATLAPGQPTLEPPKLDKILQRVEDEGWEIFAVVADPAIRAGDFNRVRVVARRPAE